MKFKREDGKEYTLTFNRDSVKRAEALGFRIDEFDERLVTNTEMLFYLSFYAKHPEVTKEESDKILYDEFSGLTPEELKGLVEEYAETYTSLINEDTSKKSRKVTIL